MGVARFPRIMRVDVMHGSVWWQLHGQPLLLRIRVVGILMIGNRSPLETVETRIETAIYRFDRRMRIITVIRARGRALEVARHASHDIVWQHINIPDMHLL